MSLKPLLSFSSGEIDPILHDRVTLAKFATGLHTGRNIIVGKTGSLLSRFARAHFKKAKNNNENIKLFSPPNSEVIIEWGNLYVRIYLFDGTLFADTAHSYTEDDLPNIHFVHTGPFVYIFLAGEETLKMRYTGSGPTFESSSVIFSPKTAPTSLTIAATGAPSGYAVDYLVTAIFNGEETLSIQSAVAAFKPETSTEYNVITVQVNPAFSNLEQYSAIKVYRKPNLGGAFGFIGSSNNLYDNAGALDADFIDLGGLADFANGAPITITKLGLDGDNIIDLHAKTGLVYQQRLLMTTEDDEEAIISSRPGHQNNFYRDFPYDADSALKFKAGSTGFAKVLRMVEQDGLIVFTSIGVYTNVGALTIDNVALERKGGWVIDETIPPLVVPGGVFFVDKATNTIRQLVFSQNNLTYETLEHSIFSDHLFREKTIESWGFQGGLAPLVIATFSDGTFATFNYNQEHKMRAWTRHDSAYPVEQVEGTGVVNSSFFVTNKDGQRYIEVSLPRHIPPATFAANPEADKLNLNAFMDAVITQSNLLNDSLAGSDVFLVALITAEWDEPLTLTCGTSGIFTAGTFGAVGTIMRFFDTTDKTRVDLKVTARASDNSVTVLPSAEFPSAQASGFRLYETFDTVTGLDHLEGENVGIFLDGYVANSPYNDIENYDPVVVSSGSITIPNSKRGAIIVVGRPIVADIKTLNINTVEQRPTAIESLNVGKLYIRVHKTRGLYASNKFPEEATLEVDGTGVAGMENLDTYDVPSDTDIIGNTYKKPVSKRIELTTEGEWDSQGQIALRQVDPVHFEILSIITDLELLNRSDR